MDEDDFALAHNKLKLAVLDNLLWNEGDCGVWFVLLYSGFRGWHWRSLVVAAVDSLFGTS
jgi:hypothetical protein